MTAQPSAPRSRISRVWRDIALTLLALILLSVLAVWLLVRGSLPRLDGDVRGLDVTATIERDDMGTPTVTAPSRNELAFATGFAHAQDRFFQMDLQRRAAAGELAELLGPSVVESDQELRVHGFKQVAQQIVSQMSSSDRALLQRYVEGVNAGLKHLSVRPWEYLLLGSAPREWTAEDSLLCAFAMYLTLNDPTGQAELARAQLHAALPEELFGFLYPVGTEWDAPLTGGTWRAPPIPTADVIDVRRAPIAATGVHTSQSLNEPEFFGSNAWAVDGAHGVNGAALIANDMHLGLRLPHVWYRARLFVTGPEARDLVGVTLPGLPVLIVGSNRHVAWGFSNSYGDWTDLVTVEPDPNQPDHYLVGDTSEPFVTRSEIIHVRDAQDVRIDITTTRWGPVVARDDQQRPVALAWTAHDPRATNMRLFDLEIAKTVDEALDVANRSGIPVQNFVAADAAGQIGWTLMGQIPVRANYDPNFPASWRAEQTGWVGWRTPQEYPRIVDSPSGHLWLANARPIDALMWLNFAGNGNYDLGARAGQIRDDLRAIPNATVADMVKIQLDDRALFLTRWRDLLLELLERSDSKDPRRAQAREFVKNWSARADASDAGYAIVRAFRLQVRRDVFDTLTANARAKYRDAVFEPSPQFEGSLWQIVTQRPIHLLNPRYQSWDEAMLASLDAAIESLRADCGDLKTCTWGRQNTLQMRHPLSTALPWLASWLDMPAQAMSGDAAMPRVQGPKFGASERLVVSPGRESEGVLQMPGGPVDHPLSPFYGAGHDAWVRGDLVPLLPGKPKHVLNLTP
jgi:penicillin G amidase